MRTEPISTLHEVVNHKVNGKKTTRKALHNMAKTYGYPTQGERIQHERRVVPESVQDRRAWRTPLFVN